MPNSNRRRTAIVAILLLLLALLLLLSRCDRTKTPLPLATVPTSAISEQTPLPPGVPPVTSPVTPEVLTPATIEAPATVIAGTEFSVTWTGPKNDGDYLTIVRKDAPERATGLYALTRNGSPLTMTAPVEPGEDWELRYMTAASRKVLGRAAIAIAPAAATLKSVDAVHLDSPLTIAWTGPANAGDFITVVASNAPDRTYGAYTLTNKGSPLTVTAPPTAGSGEIRYITGQGGKVLARRPVTITTPAISLAAPAEAIAGSNITVTWTGPANDGDYITVVPKSTRDGQHANYTTTSTGSPMKLKTPMEPGEAELRYMTGRAAKVLGRSDIRIVAAQVSLSAAPSAKVNSPIAVTWTGPANDGDYITLVPRTAPDGQNGPYTLTNQQSPLNVPGFKDPGEAELRYISGQGSKVLARRPIAITP